MNELPQSSPNYKFRCRVGEKFKAGFLAVRETSKLKIYLYNPVPATPVGT